MTDMQAPALLKPMTPSRPRACGVAMAAGLALGVGAVLGPHVQAAEPSPQVRAALEVLAGGAPQAAASGSKATVNPGSPSGVAAGGAAALSALTPRTLDAAGMMRPVVDVSRGQTLDAVVRTHFAASPLKPEVIREAVVKLNPQAFAAGRGQRLQAGARLQLPTVDDLMRHAFGAAVPAASVAQHAQADGGTAVGARRGWVRYP